MEGTDVRPGGVTSPRSGEEGEGVGITQRGIMQLFARIEEMK